MAEKKPAQTMLLRPGTTCSAGAPGLKKDRAQAAVACARSFPLTFL